MTVRKGSQVVPRIYRGDTPIQRGYRGDTLFYSLGPSETVEESLWAYFIPGDGGEGTKTIEFTVPAVADKLHLSFAATLDMDRVVAGVTGSSFVFPDLQTGARRSGGTTRSGGSGLATDPVVDLVSAIEQSDGSHVVRISVEASGLPGSWSWTVTSTQTTTTTITEFRSCRSCTRILAPMSTRITCSGWSSSAPSAPSCSSSESAGGTSTQTRTRTIPSSSTTTSTVTADSWNERSLRAVEVPVLLTYQRI